MAKMGWIHFFLNPFFTCFFFSAIFEQISPICYLHINDSTRLTSNFRKHGVLSQEALGLQCKRRFHYEKMRLRLPGLSILNSDTTVVWNYRNWFVCVAKWTHFPSRLEYQCELVISMNWQKELWASFGMFKTRERINIYPKYSHSISSVVRPTKPIGQQVLGIECKVPDSEHKLFVILLFTWPSLKAHKSRCSRGGKERGEEGRKDRKVPMSIVIPHPMLNP